MIVVDDLFDLSDVVPVEPAVSDGVPKLPLADDDTVRVAARTEPYHFG